MHKDWCIPCFLLDIHCAVYDLHHALDVSAVAIRFPVGDVILSDLVKLFSLMKSTIIILLSFCIIMSFLLAGTYN